MPSLDFPPNTAHPTPPTMGDKWPSPPVPNQPVYTWDGVKWTTHGEAVDDVIGASNLIPLADGVASAGLEANWSRGDHVHPALINDLVLTGNPTAPTPPLGDDDTTIATTAFVQATVTATEIGTSVLVGSNAPVGAADNSLWFEDDSGRLYIFYNDGTGPSQWVAAAPVPDAITSRFGIYAAPFDAMAYSGMQINGGMEISQERGTTAVSVTGTALNILDGWVVVSLGPQTIGAAQNNTVFPSGFQNSLGIGPTVANAAPGASDAVFMCTRIEGYRMARLAWGTAAAQSMTIAFWVRANRTGNYSGAINNFDSSRSYAFPFTISASNTWEYKTVTIPGDTIGTWDKTNGMGAQIVITMMAGSSFVTAANTWAAGNFLGVTGTINGVGVTSDTMYITGVTVLPGTQYPSAAQSALVMRPYDQEVATCQRYWRSLGTGFSGRGIDSFNAGGSLSFSPSLRATPTVIVVGATNGLRTPGVGTYNVGGTSANVAVTLNSIHLDISLGGGIAAGQPVFGFADGWLKLDARL